jgi:hypothetical protein
MAFTRELLRKTDDLVENRKKSCAMVSKYCFTSLINVRSPCLLVDLGLFSIFSHGSNLFKNFDTADLSEFCFFFNPSRCSRNYRPFLVMAHLFCFSRHVGKALFVAFTFGERTLIRLVKQDRKRSLRDLINEFRQSDLVPIC